MILPHNYNDLSLKEKIILNYETGMVNKKDDNSVLQQLLGKNNNNTKILKD